MGFLDRAKQAANDLVSSVDDSLAGTSPAENPEKLFRDLGMLTYLAETGRPGADADRQRVLESLRSLEQRGRSLSFEQVTLGPQAPPAPGANAAPPPPPPPPPSS